MKKDKTTYINEQRENLKQYIDAQNSGDDTRSSINAVSRSLGVSGALLSQFMNDKYPGDNETVAKKIESFLQRQVEREDYSEILIDTLPTNNFKRVYNVARICHVEGEMGVVTGDAGLGKTRALHQYNEDNPDGVILIEVIPGTTAKTLMTKIHKEIGFAGSGTQTAMFEDAREKLQGTDRLLIIDEAEHLPTSALELTRRLHDMTGIGILLSGMPKLLQNLRGLKSDFRQLYSRIGIKAELSNLKEEDVKLLVQAAIPSSNGLYKHFFKRTQNGRSLSKLMKRTLQLAQKNDIPNNRIGAEVVEKAQQYVII
ncbi:AAA family ATPase [Gracilimonas tropica]|uniref:AAA family ATPase n=1 Tax=Gracilimonas tropica TaxID=454600 RepID=UPI0003718533|nr:AAA family ATPase [Gracilimonas tropica]